MRENGRSMVEMLGVLAIIGVLSVGAIAGYSKAMMKYRLNKQAEQLNAVVNATLSYAGLWKVSNGTEIVPYLIQLGAIPQEMIKANQNTYLYDIFDISFHLVYTINDKEQHYHQMFLNLTYLNYSVEICRNILNIAKELHGNLQRMEIYNLGVSNIGYQGDNYCTPKSKCLINITNKDIENICNYTVKKDNNATIKFVIDG